MELVISESRIWATNFKAFLVKVFNAMIEARQRQANIRIAEMHLRGMTDRELNDIGIGRGDIRRVVRQYPEQSIKKERLVDPVTIISGATVAFNALKKGFAVGKDLQDMGGQLTQWAGAISDLDFADRQNAKPPWYKTLGGGVQAEAMEIFAAKKKAESMRKELKDYICVMYGPSHWDELLRIEADIRKQKKEHDHKRIEMQRKLIEWGAGFVLFLVITGSLVGFVYLRTLR